VELFWNQGSYFKTIELDSALNVALLRSAPNFDLFAAFSAEVASIESPIDEKELMCMPCAPAAQEVTDDEGSDSDDESVAIRRHPDLPDSVFERRSPDTESPNHERFTRMDFNVPKNNPHLIPEDTDAQQATPAALLLHWHYRFGHISFDRIGKMAERGDLPRKLLQATKNPRCAACAFGKMTRRPWRTKAPLNKFRVPAATAPGSVVSVDQLVSSTPGLIGQMKGFLTRKRYLISTVFVDQHSDFTYVHNQQSADAEHTIEAKRAFERKAKEHGVIVRHYHTDNGIFSSKAFMNEVHLVGQTMSFCAVNAHHQNGKAEKKIRDLQESARTMILHAARRWPEAVTANLWPFAIRYANDIANVAPSLNHDNVSPIELFSQVEVAPKLKHAHTFGSPVYVLDSALQSGKGIFPKWKHRARIGAYLGVSPRHSRQVALVLSLETGHVSPQFHCLFDDLCEMLRPSAGNPRALSRWQVKTGFVQTSVNDFAAPETIINDEVEFDRVDHDLPSIVQDQNDETNEQADNLPPPSPTHAAEPSLQRPGVQSPVNHRNESRFHQHGDVQQPYIRETRSGRVPKPIQKLSLCVPWDVCYDHSTDLTESMEDPIAFAASSNPDILHLQDAMKADDHKKFKKAMAEEVKSHEDNDHWELIKRDQVPHDTPILPAVWAFRRKRRIATQEIYKWKARLNLHGGKQELGVNYWETYSPVVGWPTIRMLLNLMILNGWVSKQVDFVLAFPQADIECDIYMEVPQGFNVNGNRKTHCLKLKKNLYGQKQAGRVWNHYMHDGLIARGFQQSQVDMCVYYRNNVVLMCYVDDGIFMAPSQAKIDKCYNLLVNEFTDAETNTVHRKFKMTDEGDLSDYLGVKIERLENGTIKLSQPHLIKQILSDLGFTNDTTSQPTPASSTKKLSKDIHGQPMDETWHYRSVIGKLNFLEKSTRPDLAYSVHQCARFSSDPKKSHAAAVKRIGRYLIDSVDKGIILNPQKHSFDCWVDADFVGNWDRVNADVDPSTARSRSAFIIMYGGCPISWTSKLQ